MRLVGLPASFRDFQPIVGRTLLILLRIALRRRMLVPRSESSRCAGISGNRSDMYPVEVHLTRIFNPDIGRIVKNVKVESAARSAGTQTAAGAGRKDGHTAR